MDVRVSNQGTVWVFTPITPEGQDWVDQHLELQGWQWLGGESFAVDHRPAESIVHGMRGDGLVVTG